MEINKVKRKPNKTIQIGLKISAEESTWMKENDISPTAVFKEALKELMEDDEDAE